MNGRPFNAQEFARDLEKKALEVAINALMDRALQLSGSMIDAETGRHPVVLAWPTSPTSIHLVTSGSNTFALALERRLVGDGLIPGKSSENNMNRLVYLAHASEDHALATALARHLMASGINVWFDQWEIRAGDSLRQRMESGLGACTHFVVLVSSVSLTKPWVNQEIDAGLVLKIEGQSKFIPLRVGLPPSDLPPFLKSVRSPAIDAGDPSTFESIVSDILDVVLKPPLGEVPRHVHRLAGLEHFSTAAIAVAKAMVEQSAEAGFIDRELDIEEICTLTGLSEEDAEVGILDLVEGGYLEDSKVLGSTSVWPKGPLFITFDPHFMGWQPVDDAREIAVRMVNSELRTWTAEELHAETGWPKRRLNAALAAVEAAQLALTSTFIGGEGYIVSELSVTTQTKRAARG